MRPRTAYAPAAFFRTLTKLTVNEIFKARANRVRPLGASARRCPASGRRLCGVICLAAAPGPTVLMSWRCPQPRMVWWTLSRRPMRLKARIDGVSLGLGHGRGQRRDRFTGLGLIGSPGGRPSLRGGLPAVKAAGTIGRVVDSACGYRG